MRKEWQVGAIVSFLATITIILVGNLTTWPYLVQLLLALIIGVLSTVVTHKILQSNMSIYKTLRYVQIIFSLVLLLGLTLDWFKVIRIPDNVMSLGIGILVILLIISWIKDKDHQKSSKKES